MVFYLTLPHYALAIRPIGLIRPVRPTLPTLPARLPTLPTSSARQLGLPALLALPDVSSPTLHSGGGWGYHRVSGWGLVVRVPVVGVVKIKALPLFGVGDPPIKSREANEYIGSAL